MVKSIVGKKWTHQRRNRRVLAPVLKLELDGTIYQTLNWSLGGFLIWGYRSERAPGGYLTVRRAGPMGREMMLIDTQARVVRFDPETGRLACAFEDLRTDVFDMLQALMLHKEEREHLRCQARRRQFGLWPKR